MKKLTYKKISENRYAFPHWSTVDTTYSGAVVKVLAAIKESRPFYNYRDGELDEQHLRERPEKIAGINQCTSKGIVTIDVQLGHKWKGVSVEQVRKLYTEGEYGLGAYEVGCILLASPELIQSSDDLFLDCPGDEFDNSYSDVRFGHAPVLYWHDGRLEFGAPQFGVADGRFGSASFFVPSGSNKSLTQNKKGDTLELCHIKINHQDYKLSLTELSKGVEIQIPVVIKIMGAGE